MRILVADPSRTMRNIARAVLAQLGYYDVDEAADANEAVSRASFANFDLCIFDRAIKAQDGSSLLRALRRAGNRAGFIELRTADFPSGPADESELPLSQSLCKPFAPEALRRCIDAAITAQSAAQAA
ncbi:MAG: response regulator [Phycisphaerales bacterium]|nr:response regulator [Phycisphaerales bacterium]